MLGEVAITPDVFARESYESESTAGALLQVIKGPLLEDVVVRNLYGGAWRSEIQSLLDNKLLAPRGKELLKGISHRLVNDTPCRETPPVCVADWGKEALLSHKASPMDCILTTSKTKDAVGPDEILGCVHEISRHPWWRDRDKHQSRFIPRTIEAYLFAMRTVLRTATHIAFIDPYLDPDKERYGEFYRLLLECACPNRIQPMIQVHRLNCEKIEGKRNIVSIGEWSNRFDSAWRPHLSGSGLTIEILLWKEMHDRFLLTNLFGMLAGNGYDVSKRPDNRTLWSRISAQNREQLETKFDPAVNVSNFHGRLTLKF